MNAVSFDDLAKSSSHHRFTAPLPPTPTPGVGELPLEMILDHVERKTVLIKEEYEELIFV